MIAIVLTLWAAASLGFLQRPGRANPDLCAMARDFAADLRSGNAIDRECAPRLNSCDPSRDSQGTLAPTQHDIAATRGQLLAVIDFYVDKLESLGQDLDDIRCELIELRRRGAAGAEPSDHGPGEIPTFPDLERDEPVCVPQGP